MSSRKIGIIAGGRNGVMGSFVFNINVDGKHLCNTFHGQTLF